MCIHRRSGNFCAVKFLCFSVPISICPVQAVKDTRWRHELIRLPKHDVVSIRIIPLVRVFTALAFFRVLELGEGEGRDGASKKGLTVDSQI